MGVGLLGDGREAAKVGDSDEAKRKGIGRVWQGIERIWEDAGYSIG